MKNFNSFLLEAKSSRPEDAEKFAISWAEYIDNKISSVSPKIEIDSRPKKHNSSRVGVHQWMPAHQRAKYVSDAYSIIKKTTELSSVAVPNDRIGKDFAFKSAKANIMPKLVYVNNSPDGKSSGQGSDPNELITAVLCTFNSINLPKDPKNTDAIDIILDRVIQVASSDKVVGHTAIQLNAIKGDYVNFASAFSAAIAIRKKVAVADKVYLTGSAWDADVKQFRLSKHGMVDFNSSDFIIKTGNTYTGISLKKKTSEKSSDPTLINKSFNSLLATSEFANMQTQLEERAAAFYINVINSVYRDKQAGNLSKADSTALAAADFTARYEKNKPTAETWKLFINNIPNALVNKELKTSGSILGDMAAIINDNAAEISNKLVNLIFKADLKELQKVNFDFALVTGIGNYGIQKGFQVKKGKYIDIETSTTILDEFLSAGKPNIKLDKSKVQAFEPGATAAGLYFILSIGKHDIANINLRFKGNFRSAPSLLAIMTPELSAALNV